MADVTQDASTHVRVSQISKRFGGVTALSDIDLTIRRGTIHALVGENGAGKSTLSKIIAGMYTPDEGELMVDGRSIAFRDPHHALKHGITLMAQEIALVPNATVWENVFLGARTQGRLLLNRQRARRECQRLIERTGLDVDLDAKAGELRLSDQQKVELLRAIARDARLIIMDEPTAALPAEDAEKFFDITRGLRDAGTTIVYISHFLADVLSLSDDISIMKDGRVVRTVSAQSETPASLITGMLGRNLEHAYPPKRLANPDAPVRLSVQEFSVQPMVDRVSFELRAGEIVCIAGLVGSGRTEFVRALFGDDARATGAVHLDGQPVRFRSPKDAVRAGLALVPESRKTEGLVLNASVRENLLLPHLRRASRFGVRRRTRENALLEPVHSQVGLRTDRMGLPVEALSGGNQQKVAIGRWLTEPPRVLIADEPTRGVDVGAKFSIYQTLVELAAAGTAVLVVSSELEEVTGLAHRILVMRQGRISAELQADASHQTILSAAFSSEEEVKAR